MPQPWKMAGFFAVVFITALLTLTAIWMYFEAIRYYLSFYLYESRLAALVFLAQTHCNHLHFLALGLFTEVPLAIALASFKVVSPQWLAARRKLWFVVAFIVAAIITPTRNVTDPIDQIFAAIPLILLWELWILAARWLNKKSHAVAMIP